MKLFSAFTMSLLLATPAYGASIFMPDATFDFAGETTTVSSSGVGSGALTTLVVQEPVSAGSGTISMTVDRIGPNFDLKELDTRFPDEWFAALDPSVQPGDGAFCDTIDDTGCFSFTTSFSFPLTAAEVEFTDLGGPVGSFDVYEVQLRAGDGVGSMIVIPDLADVAAFRNDPDGTMEPIDPNDVRIGPNGVIQVICDGTVCNNDSFVSVEIAPGSSVFRSLLFRGYETFNPDSLTPSNSNSAYVGRVAVSVVPEPTTIALFGFSAVSILALARRRRE